MSSRAELVRLCLPWFMRPRLQSDIQIGNARRQVARFAQLVPRPPRGTELVVVDAGGVKAERIATPRSLQTDTSSTFTVAPICSAFRRGFAILTGELYLAVISTILARLAIF